MKTLLLFYSRTDTTAVVARAIADACGAECERVRDRTPRAGRRGYWRSFAEAVFGQRAEIEPITHDPAAYDLVIVGTPVWCSGVSSPVRTLLGDRRGTLPRVAFFCTFGGTGSSRAFAQMARIAGREPIATADVRADAVEAGTYVTQLRAFSRQLAADRDSHGRGAAASRGQTVSAGT